MFVFEGRNPQRMAQNHETFLLSAASDAERQDWIKAIRYVMFASIGGGKFRYLYVCNQTIILLWPERGLNYVSGSVENHTKCMQ